MSHNEKNLKTLRGIIGPDLFRRVMDQLHGERLYFPGIVPGYASITERNQALMEDFQHGMTRAEMMQKYQIDYETIRKIIARMKA